MSHNGHRVLGHYCWDCQTRTSASNPAFEKRSAKNDAPKRLIYIPSVVTWIDGTRDWPAGSEDRAACIMCGSHTCSSPVHTEKYHIQTSVLAADWDVANPVI